MQTFIKGLIMAILSFVALSIQQNGFPTLAVQWELMGITILGISFVYVAQNYVIKSTSAVGTVDLINVIKGLILALGTGLSDFAAHWAANQPIHVSDLLKAAGAVLIAYFVKSFATKPSVPTS